MLRLLPLGVGSPGPGPATALFRSTLRFRSTVSERREWKTPTPPKVPRDPVSRDVARARRNAARGGTPWREMNDHDIARVGDVAQAEAARIKRAELHRKQSEDRLAEVLAAHRDTPPQKVDSSCGTAANLPPNASVGRPQLSEAVSAMRSALDNLDVHAFGWMWLSLMETKAYTALTNADWAAINRKLANGLRGSEQQLYQGKLHGHISELVYLDPEVFQAVCHFVVEAAAHHHWESLLQTQFELLRFNHAAFSKTVFEAYKARGIVVDGVDVSLESSKERAERLAARLKSEGMRPLILTYVAALTILDKFDESTSRTFMGLDTDGITRRYARQNDLWQIQRRVLEGRHDTKVLVHRFRDNCEKMTLIFYACHADAFALHIHHLSTVSPGDTSALDRLYSRVLQASIGPKRFIRPAVDAVRSAKDVILPWMVWAAFATAYAGLQRPEVIIRMMEEHLPARYDRVPLMALETASRSLALTASKMPDLAPRIQRYLDVVWQRMLAMGGARSASAVYSRLVTLLRTNQFKGFLATASTLHANLLKARDPLADAAVVPQLIAFHLRMQNYDEALRLLQGLGKFDGSDGFTAVMIRDLLKFSCYANYPHAKRTKLVTEVLRKADASQISATSRGLLLRFLLDGGNPIEGACATLISSDYLSPGYYLKILRRLTQPKGDPTNIPIVYLEAAVHILERQVPTNRAYAGATNTAIWNTVVKSISMSNATEGERATLVKRALECFPDTCQTNARHRLALMRSIVMDSLARDDPFPELAQHWWRQLYAMDSGMHYRPEIEAAVAGFVHAGLLESAMEVIEIACKTATMHGTLRSVLEERDEWTTPEFEQALYGAGITHSNGEIVQRLPRFDVTYGNTRWDDGVKFGDEWGRQSWPDESADGMEGVVEEMEVDEIEVEEMEADEMGADDALEDVD